MKRFFASIVIICGYLTPAPSPSVTTPAPNPTTTTPVPVPDPSTTNTPAPQSGVTTTTPAPNPSTTQPTKRTMPTPAPKTSEKHKLANTGYSALIAGTFAILLVLFGAGIYSVSRKDN